MPSALNSNISWSQVENGYYLNNLRDYTTKSGNNDDPINLLLDDDYFFGEENLQNTNQNKSPFELERMRDYFLSVKLDAYHPENYKISTDLISTKNNISFR
jgi:hypothetical protein